MPLGPVPFGPLPFGSLPLDALPLDTLPLDTLPPALGSWALDGVFALIFDAPLCGVAPFLAARLLPESDLAPGRALVPPGPDNIDFSSSMNSLMSLNSR